MKGNLNIVEVKSLAVDLAGTSVIKAPFGKVQNIPIDLKVSESEPISPGVIMVSLTPDYDCEILVGNGDQINLEQNLGMRLYAGRPIMIGVSKGDIIGVRSL